VSEPPSTPSYNCSQQFNYNAATKVHTQINATISLSWGCTRLNASFSSSAYLNQQLEVLESSLTIEGNATFGTGCSQVADPDGGYFPSSDFLLI